MRIFASKEGTEKCIAVIEMKNISQLIAIGRKNLSQARKIYCSCNSKIFSPFLLASLAMDMTYPLFLVFSGVKPFFWLGAQNSSCSS
jgi:hypothetical protein